MAQGSGASWRRLIVTGCVAGTSLLMPLTAAAQENGPTPSGAAVTLGGVGTTTGEAPQGAAPSANQAGTQGAAPAALGNTSGAAPATANLGASQGAAPSGGANAGATRVGNAPASVTGAQQARPVVLPNTGTGPAADDTPAMLAAAGLLILVAGVYIRRRGSRARVGA